MHFSEFWGHNPILRRKSGLCTLNLPNSSEMLIFQIIDSNTGVIFL